MAIEDFTFSLQIILQNTTTIVITITVLWYNSHSYPQWPHRQDVASHAAVARSSPAECTDLYNARGAQGVLPMRVVGATSQLDLPSLTPLSVAGCG